MNILLRIGSQFDFYTYHNVLLIQIVFKCQILETISSRELFFMYGQERKVVRNPLFFVRKYEKPFRNFNLYNKIVLNIFFVYFQSQVFTFKFICEWLFRTL